jgi:hypothetical protein
MAKAVRHQRDPKLFGIGDAILEKLEGSLGKSLFHIHAQGRAAIILQGLATSSTMLASSHTVRGS